MENKPEENSLEDVLRWMDEDIDHAFERVLDPLEYGENEDATLIWQVVKDSERLLKQLSLQCAEMKEENGELRGSLITAQEEKWALNQEIEALKVNELNANSQIEQLQEEVERLRKENTKTSALLDLASADARLGREEVERHEAVLKATCVDFFYWWHNQPGTNTEEGFEAYIKTDRYKALSCKESKTDK